MRTSERLYQHGQVRYPSVTTILSVIDKPALVRWAANTEREMVLQAAVTCQRVFREQKLFLDDAHYLSALEGFVGTTRASDKKLKEAGEIGSAIHALVEWHTRSMMQATPGPRPVWLNPETLGSVESGFAAWRVWADSVGFVPKFLEQAIVHTEAGYAGRMDFLGTVSGHYTLGDYKTGKAIYKEAILQVAAYRQALFSMGHKVPDRAVIVRLPKNVGDPAVDVQYVEKDELDSAYQAFLQVMSVWQWVRAHEKPWGRQVQQIVPDPAVTTNEQPDHPF